MERNEEMHDYKVMAMKAAKDFGYPREVLRKIKKAKNDAEISRIMLNARKAFWDDEF